MEEKSNMNEGNPYSGAWELTAIMIAVASWLFCRYFAPRTWRNEVRHVAVHS